MEAISHLNVSYAVRGDAVVSWQLNPLFASENPGPYQFTLFRSLSGTGDWVEIGQVEDSYFMIDDVQSVFGRGPWPAYYLTVLASNGVSKESRVVRAWGDFSAHDTPIVRDILRRERLLARRAGRCGLLYKRRQWGEPCAENISQDTGEIVPRSADTDDCYGTGFAGGYFDPVECWLVPSNRAQSEGKRLGIDLTKGHSDEGGRISHWRGQACPDLDTDDVWVDYTTDRRYFVQRVWIVDFRGVPIILDPVELRLAATDDVIYRLPRP